MFQVLVLEDDRELNRSLCTFMRKNGFLTTSCLNAAQAFEALRTKKFDLILSDIMLPETDGFLFAGEVRKLDREIPMMFLSVRDDFHSKRRGFETGIDDYMVKPVDPEELLLRVRALLRRAKIASSKRITLGNTTLDADAYTATVNGQDLGLSVREFNLLYKLLSYPEKTFTRSQLMEEFWSADSPSGVRTVDVYMAKIREKTEESDAFQIRTVRGLGYKAVLAFAEKEDEPV